MAYTYCSAIKNCSITVYTKNKLLSVTFHSCVNFSEECIYYKLVLYQSFSPAFIFIHNGGKFIIGREKKVFG